jgi:hypothetical protein
VSELSAFPQADTAAVPVFARIYGLRPSTTYHFRIVAVGEGGTAYGGDETFSTQAPWTFNEGGSSGTSASAQSGVGAAAGGVEALIARQLAPLGRIARIGAMLWHGAFKARFSSPEAGMAVIDWYYHPPSGRGARRTAPRAVLIASGARTFHAAGTASLEIRLTAQGRRLLKGLRQIWLTATCVLTPVGASSGSPLRTSAAFELRS